MERNNRELWSKLQAQETEVKKLRLELDRNRTSAPDRTRKGKTPTPHEGRDGDERFVQSGGEMYRYWKAGGRWYRNKAESINTVEAVNVDNAVEKAKGEAEALLGDHEANFTNPHKVTDIQVLPSVTGEGGNFLTTDGSSVSWGTPASGGSDKEYASFYTATGGRTGLSNTEIILVLDQTRVNSDTGVFSLASNQVTVDKTGTYEISVDVYLNNSSTARTEYSMYLKRNGTEETATRSGNYQRGYDSGQSSSINLILDVTSGDYFEIAVIRTGGSATAGYQDNNGTRFSIKEL